MASIYKYGDEVGDIPWGLFDDYPHVVRVVGGEERTYAQVGDYLFTAHALERMAPATPEVIEELTKKYTEIALSQGMVEGSAEFINFLNKSKASPSPLEQIIYSSPLLFTRTLLLVKTPSKSKTNKEISSHAGILTFVILQFLYQYNYK